jgi:carbon storage regulator
MLVLSRRLGQRILIGEGAAQVKITVVEIDRGKIRLGIDCDRRTPIYREELVTTTRPWNDTRPQAQVDNNERQG